MPFIGWTLLLYTCMKCGILSLFKFDTVSLPKTGKIASFE